MGTSELRSALLEITVILINMHNRISVDLYEYLLYFALSLIKCRRRQWNKEPKERNIKGMFVQGSEFSIKLKLSSRGVDVRRRREGVGGSSAVSVKYGQGRGYFSAFSG